MTTADTNLQCSETSSPAVSFEEALKTWAKIGILNFGGPTAQIALMHRIIVDEKKWLDERRYLSALGFCMLLPGPEAMQSWPRMSGGAYMVSREGLQLDYCSYCQAHWSFSRFP